MVKANNLAASPSGSQRPSTLHCEGVLLDDPSAHPSIRRVWNMEGQKHDDGQEFQEFVQYFCDHAFRVPRARMHTPGGEPCRRWTVKRPFSAVTQAVEQAVAFSVVLGAAGQSRRSGLRLLNTQTRSGRKKAGKLQRPPLLVRGGERWTFRTSAEEVPSEQCLCA